MGSQICFFITPNDFAYLLDKTLSYDIIILDKYGEEITPGELYSKIEYGYERKICHSDNYYFTKNGFNISYFSDSGLLDFQKSEVIQFSFCKNSPPKILDKSTIDQRFLKNGFIVIDDSAEYSKLLDDIIKNPVYKDNPNYIENGYEHGRLWFANSYYDEYGIKITKSDELKKFYSSMQRFIKKNWKLSNDKFGYIGIEAYRLYLQNQFIPCSGKSRIKFDGKAGDESRGRFCD